MVMRSSVDFTTTVRPRTKPEGLAHGRKPEEQGGPTAQSGRRSARQKEKTLRSSLTLSEYARQMVLTGKVTAPASPEELRLVAELTREKNNLNQLAKAQNAAGAAAREAELMRIIRFYNRVIAKLKKSGV